jgi:putative MFS transporter
MSADATQAFRQQAGPIDRAGNAAERVNIAGRIERLPMTSYQRRVFAIIATAWLADQIDVALLTFLLGSIVVAFHLSPVQAGSLAAMTFAGQLLGNIAAGLTADRFGRRLVFQVTMVIWGLASFAAAGAWSLAALMTFRLFIGIGVGGEAPVAQAMVSELLPAAVRGKYIAFMEGFWAVGYVASGAISFFILPHFGWRAVFIAVGMFSLVVLVVRRGLPESPRWLSDRGRFAEAEAVMAKIESEVRRRTGRALPEPQVFETETHAHANSFATIFSREYIRRTVMAFGVWFFALLGFFGLNSWLAILLKSHGFSIIGSVGFVTLITLGGIPGFYVTGLLLERLGRKPVTAAVLVLGAASAYVYGTATTVTTLFVTGFIMQFFMFGMWSALYAYTPELYPTRARATGAGFASAFGRLGAIIGPILLPIVVASAGAGAAFKLGAAAFCIAALLVATLGVETKGRILETVSA